MARTSLKEDSGGYDDEFTRVAMTAAPRKLRIAQVAPPLERVPPVAYGGTERIVHGLATELAARGHEITVFASGDSDVPGTLVPTVDKALRPAGIEGDASGWFLATVQAVLERASEFDIIHSHLEWWSIPLARMTPVPMVSTFHGRLDLPWSERLFEDAPEGLVAISRSQASAHPKVPWTIIHNGLVLDQAPFQTDRTDAFCFVGRVDPEKGIVDAMDIAALSGRPLKLAAKVGNLPEQRAYYENVFEPALKRASRNVEFLGELSPEDRDRLFAESYGTLMPGAWPEPFGLVSIESLACGTPILARRVGALDRRAIRERVIERFSAARMTDRYEELYARMIGHGGRASKPAGSGFRITPAPGRPGQVGPQPGPFGANEGSSSPASTSTAGASDGDATGDASADAAAPRNRRSPAATSRS